MKHLFSIFLLVSLFSCQGDENVLHDYDLFGRLQRGTGTWKVESYDSFQNNDLNSVHVVSEPEDEYYEFYIHTQEIAGTLVDLNSANFHKNGTIQLKTCEAEKERVVFNSTLGGGEVWTVKENKARKQVWVFVNGNNTTVMTLKKSTSRAPRESTTQENKG